VKAIVAEPPKKNSARLAEVPEPHAESGEVLLQTQCVGIDGTDREISEGVYGVPPEGSSYLVLGHEAIARVHELGKNVQGFAKGDSVVPTVRRPCKENCLNCRNGETDKCLTGNYFEHGIFKLHGFASEYAVCEADFLVKVPSNLEDIAVLLEPLSIAENAVSQIFRIQERMSWKAERAFVNGAGPLGLLATLILRLRGLEVSTAATRGNESLKARIVRSTGGSYINISENPMTSFPRKFDIVMEATGKVSAAIEALNLLGPNGVMCFLGIYREQIACQEFGKVLTSMVLGNRLMFGSVSSNKNHFEMSIKDAVETKAKFGNVMSMMITERLSPENYAGAFEPDRETIKTIICFKP
jgi:threonine dehydrogenase-like Zn-dependent dehydrogenase